MRKAILGLLAGLLLAATALACGPMSKEDCIKKGFELQEELVRLEQSGIPAAEYIKRYQDLEERGKKLQEKCEQHF